MITFEKYVRVPGGFESGRTQQVKETTEFTTTPVQVPGFYWISGPLSPTVFRLQLLEEESTQFGLRSIGVIPRPPTQIEILTELQKLVDRQILCGGGDHEKVALEIGYDQIPEHLKGLFICDGDTIYLPL